MSPISATSVPLREGLFGETDAGPTLMASHCAQCDHTAFPRVDRCTNCRADDQETVEFGGEGKLLCATVVYMGNGRFSPGYSVGYVTMPPGLRVFGQLAFSGTEPPMPGTPMRLEIAPLWREGKHDVLAYRFMPAEEGNSHHA